ncbi:MAG: hypothetical protein NTY05_13340 [Rhodocyclales bacterium]|nr:hypothetical protein [Rhodocyclales bacterium]
MRYVTIVLWTLFWSMTSAIAQVSIGIGLPGMSIGINLPLFPTLVRVPGYPVYYAPQLDSNFFFYDGMYWVYEGDNWYASSWYNGPWGLVGPEFVPLFVLRIPVGYYRNPPMYFRGWRSDAPPRWGDHWGNEWQQRRSGWDRWQRSSVPAIAPLPIYQRQYSGDRYPRVEQQHELNSRNYRYQPRDAAVRQHYEQQSVQRPALSQQGAPQERTPRPQEIQRSNPPPQFQQGGPVVPRAPSPQKGDEDNRRSAPTQAPSRQRDPATGEQRQQSQQGTVQREQQAPKPGQESNQRGKGMSQEPRQEQEKDREKRDERGPERNR